MKVKKISCFNGQSEDYIKTVGHDGEIVYISMNSIISITVQTNGDIVIRCVHNEVIFYKMLVKDNLKTFSRMEKNATTKKMTAIFTFNNI